MGLKVAGVMSIILLVVGGLFYWYFDHSQKTIRQLEANVAKLELAINEQADTINALEQHAEDQAQQVVELQTNLNAANNYRATLEKLLREHDLTALARSRPGLIENRMNAATTRLWDDLEALTGGGVPDNSTETDSTFRPLDEVNAQTLQ